MRRGNVLAIFSVVALLVCFSAWRVLRSRPAPATLERVSLRLQWFPQAQFCGFLVAKDKGWFREAGLDVDLRPAGPDLKPQVSVAAGTDDFGVGVSNQVITARANGVPLRIVAQIFQGSANRYVLRRRDAIQTLHDLRGRRVGLWTGGDEAEFVAMLHGAGMSLRDVEVVPQGYEVTPFLQGAYVLSQVTTYNELNQLRTNGLGDDQLQILDPDTYQAAIAADMLFTTDDYLRRKPDVARKVVLASLRGWSFCLHHEEEALDAVLRAAPSLDRAQQRLQLREVNQLVSGGAARVEGIGAMKREAYATAERVLRMSGQLSNPVDLNTVFDDTIIRSLPAEVRQVDLPSVAR